VSGNSSNSELDTNLDTVFSELKEFLKRLPHKALVKFLNNNGATK